MTGRVSNILSELWKLLDTGDEISYLIEPYLDLEESLEENPEHKKLLDWIYEYEKVWKKFRGFVQSFPEEEAREVPTRPQEGEGR